MKIRNPLKLVCIGGGTGLSSLLSGLKLYTRNKGEGSEIIDMDNLAAVVSVSDDGGSSGRLIEEFDVIPPGDIRKLLVALSDANELVAALFEYRFTGSGSLGGHTVGNLLLIALTELNGGSFPKAIRDASKLLATRGRILPVSLDHTELCAELISGEVVCGESKIPSRATRNPIQRVFLRPREVGNHQPPSGQLYECAAYNEAVESIVNADAIIIGPGSLYTSIIPNLVIPRIVHTLRSSNAVKIYICNIMTQPGETDGYSVTDHVRAIYDHAKHLHFDYVIVNNQLAPEAILRNYVYREISEVFLRIKMSAGEGLSWLEKREDGIIEELRKLTERISQLSHEARQIADLSRVQVFYCPERDHLDGTQVVEADLIRDMVIFDRGNPITVIRHDPEKLAQTLAKVLGDHPKLRKSTND
jgi:uncharacterized cofD-like protein